LNYGTSDVGSGEPLEEVGSAATQPEEPTKNEPEKSEEQVKQEVTPTEVKTDEKEKIDGTEEIEKKKDEPKIIEKPKEKSPDKPAEVKKDTEVKQKVNTESVYDPNKKAGTDSKSTDAKSGSEGDDKDKVGDKGKPEGTLIKGGQYTGNAGSGGPGTGGSGGVSMSGFNGFEWPKVEAPSLPDEAYGVYEFMVKVDDQGDVISVTPLQRGLSLEAERKFKEVIQKLTFIPKGTNLPPQSEGKITFKVVSK
jgi:periplasmic protein TonB